MRTSHMPKSVQQEIGEGRFEAYRIKADPAVAIVAAFYLVLLLTPKVAETSLESAHAIFALDIVFWVVLTVDTICRALLSTDHRTRITRWAGVALLLSGPLVFLQISDTTRELVRLALISVAAFRAVNSVRFFFRLRSIFLVVSAVVLIVLAFGVSMTVTEERLAGSNIKTLSDGLWWAASTVSTVGYGDKFPISNQGRVIATSLMFIGVALFSILTATLANSFAVRAEQGASDEFASIHQRLERIEHNQQKDRPVRRARAPRRPPRRTPPPTVTVPTGDKE